jgi:hypothetical protein
MYSKRFFKIDYIVGHKNRVRSETWYVCDFGILSLLFYAADGLGKITSSVYRLCNL